MVARGERRPQRIDGQRGTVLANVRLALEKALAPLVHHRGDKAPERQAAEQKRRVIVQGHVEHAVEYEAQDGGHRHRLKERPPQTEERTAVAAPQVVADQGEPEVS